MPGQLRRLPVPFGRLPVECVRQRLRVPHRVYLGAQNMVFRPPVFISVLSAAGDKQQQCQRDGLNALFRVHRAIIAYEVPRQCSDVFFSACGGQRDAFHCGHGPGSEVRTFCRRFFFS